MKPFLPTLVATACTVAFGCLLLPLHAQVAIKNQGYLPFSEEPINYRSDNLNDPVAKLQKKMDRGEVKLSYESPHGYLKSVLEKLGIPVQSQTLDDRSVESYPIRTFSCQNGLCHSSRSENP